MKSEYLTQLALTFGLRKFTKIMVLKRYNLRGKVAKKFAVLKTQVKFILSDTHIIQGELLYAPSSPFPGTRSNPFAPGAISSMPQVLQCISMFIFSQFCASVTSARKPFMHHHSNKITREQIDQSLEHAVIHTGTYAGAYGTQGHGSNMKYPRKEENILLNVVQLHHYHRLIPTK